LAVFVNPHGFLIIVQTGLVILGAHIGSQRNDDQAQ